MREFLMLLRETAFLTADLTAGAPTAGSFAYIRLDEGNAFTMRPKSLRYEFPYGGGIATKGLTGSDAVECKGTLKTKLYASQASLILPWLITPIDAGRTAPWTTTDAGNVMPVGDLASMSIYHAVIRSDGTFKLRRYGGAKATAWRISVSQDLPRVATLEIDLEAAKPFGNTNFGGIDADPTTTEFPTPADSDFPTDPYVFSHLTFTLGTSRTLITQAGLSVRNIMDPRRFTSKYLQINGFHGRESQMTGKLIYAATPDDRASYEAVTAQSASLVLDDGTVTSTFNYHGKNYLEGVDDDTALEKAYDQGIQIGAYYDPAASTDISVTVV